MDGDYTGRAGFIIYPFVDLVLEEMPRLVILQPISQTSTEEACVDKLCYSVIDGKL